MVRRVLRSLNETIGLPVTIKYATTSISFCLSLFVISKALAQAAEYGSSISSGIAVLSLASMLLVLCIVGESLEAQNSELLFNLYDLPWHQLKPQDRKSLNLAMRQAQKPIYINYHGITNLNLNAYTQVMNTSYSYFMLLKSTIR